MAANTKRRSRINYLVKVALLSALSFVLMYLEFPIGIVPPWLKLDFSDLPAVLAAFSLGPVAGVICQVVKVLLFTLIHGTTSGFIGELGNLLMGIALVLPAGLIYKYKHNRKFALISMIVGIVSMTVMSFISNYFLLIPVYAEMMGLEAIIGMCTAIVPAADSVMAYCLIFAMPFTFAKALIDCIVIFLCYKKISPILHKQY